MRAKFLSYDDRREPEEISAVLGAVVENVTVAADVRQGEIVSDWASFAPGDWMLGTPVGIKDGSLLVTVPDGSTGSLLRYQTNTLLGAIVDRFGAGVVVGVRVRIERSHPPDSSRE
jgi:Dna[CI] antecedent, DciA